MFKQGDEGTCWYIIYKGKVEVLVNGSVVCLLSDGDGFGELALINDKPRSATIRAFDICQFIKVEKGDYNRILKVRCSLLGCCPASSFIHLFLLFTFLFLGY